MRIHRGVLRFGLVLFLTHAATIAAWAQDARATQDIAKRVLRAFAKDHVNVRWFMYTRQVCADDNYRKSIVRWAGSNADFSDDIPSNLDARILSYLECQPRIASQQPAVEQKPVASLGEKPASVGPPVVPQTNAVAQPDAQFGSTGSQEVIRNADDTNRHTARFSTVNRPFVNFRSGPGTSYPLLDSMKTLNQGSIVKLTGNTEGGWEEVEVSSSDGKSFRGFVFGQFLTPTEAVTGSVSHSQTLDDIALQSAVKNSPVRPPLAIASGDGGASISVKCNNAPGYLAVNGDELDESKRFALREGSVISGAVIYMREGDQTRFYKGQFSGKAVFVKESDIEGVDCDTRSWWTIPKPDQCPTGFAPQEGWLCRDRYGQTYAVGSGRPPPEPPRNSGCPPGQGRHPVTGMCVPTFYSLH